MAAQPIFHASIEGAQHGAKGLADFLDYAKRSGAAGTQPSNYMLQGGKFFKSAKEIKDTFAQRGMTFDGISAHCPFWDHASAWTGTRSGNPFIPGDVAKKSPEKIEKWAEDYLLKLMDLALELKVKIMPMFWGVAFGWELATGYPWGFWQGGDYDLYAERKEEFSKTAKESELQFNLKKSRRARRKCAFLGMLFIIGWCGAAYAMSATETISAIQTVGQFIRHSLEELTRIIICIVSFLAELYLLSLLIKHTLSKFVRLLRTPAVWLRRTGRRLWRRWRRN